jgi:hypothetical protein
MKLKDLNIENIKAYIQGNSRMLGSKFNMVNEHIQEQVAWRAEICKDDCMAEGKCKECGCDVPGKLYVNKSCNGGKRFPDLMEKGAWEKYKNKHSITL